MAKLKPSIVFVSILLLAFTLYLGYRTNFNFRQNTNVRSNVEENQDDQSQSRQSALAVAPKKFQIISDSSLPAKIAASVNGESISTEDFERRVHKTLFVIKASGADFENNKEAAIQQLRETVIDELIHEKVILQLASQFKIMATDDDVKARLEATKANFTSEEWQALLESRGITEEHLNTYNRLQITKGNLISWMGGEDAYTKYLEKEVEKSKVLVNEPVINQLLTKL